jgi:hypothetical protein
MTFYLNSKSFVNIMLAKYLGICYVYGAARNLVYAPKMKKDEYITDRILKFSMYTIASPIMTPTYLYCDFKNIEQILRKMPGPIDRSPW